MHNHIVKSIKATIINIIVALFIMIIILLGMKLFVGTQIDDILAIVNAISIESNQKQEIKETVINEKTNEIQNYPQYGTQYATIEIPKIDANLPVYFGDTLEILKKGVGHSSGSYFPGEGGSIIYMGHNSKDVFRRFSELQVGNEITVKTNYGEYKYKIYDMQIINETEGYKLPVQKEKEILMVYTCYPFINIGHATQRYVVFSELVE